MANFPTYISCDSQENYNIELIQTLTDNLSDNGWIVPQITTPNLNLISSGMPDGTLWYLTDSTPPSPVMKINGIIIPLSSGSVATSVTGTTNQINVSPTTGAVVVSLANNAILPGTGGVTLPQGNTAARAGGSGTIRFNSQTGVFESTSDGINWATIETSAIGVVSVSGTAGRITCSPTIGSVVVDIDSTYVGQTSITTTGIITSGTWHASTVDVAYGGTGIATTTPYSVICAGTTATGAFQSLSSLGTLGQVLTSGGPSALPGWSSLVTGVSSVTGTANQIDVSPTAGACVVSLDSAIILPGTLTTSNTVTLNGLSASQALVTDASKNIASMPYVSTIGHGGTSNIAARDVYGNVSFNSIATSVDGRAAIGTITLTVGSPQNQVFSSGSGTAIVILPDATTLVTGWLYTINNNASGLIHVQASGTGTDLFTVPPGGFASTYLLTNSFTSGIWDWYYAIDSPSGVLTPFAGGTGLSNPTAHGILISEGSSNFNPIVLTAGQILIGTTALDPAAATLTSGSNISITSASGSITIAATGVITSVAGTANQIDVNTIGGVSTISIDANYVGQSSITTLGTITSGTWNGSIIDLVHGGTNANLTASNGGIFYSTASAGAILSGTSTAHQVLLSGSSATPAWSTATYPATTTINQLLYSSAGNTISGLPTATNGVLITDATVGIPSISSTLPSTVQGNITTTGTITSGAWHGSIITGTYGGTGVNNGTSTITIGGNVTFSGAFTFAGTLTNNTAVTFPTSGTLATTSQIPAFPLSLANGGTNANLTASNGGIFYSTASAGAILSGTSTAGKLLLSGASTTPAWSTSTYPSTNAINTLLYASAANTMNALATANSAMLVTNTSGVPAWSSSMTNGQVVIGATAGTPTPATLIAGPGISITNGPNTITINNINPGAATTPGRNRVINGDMQVWQRGAGGSASFSVPINTTMYTVDRWQVNTTGNTLSVQQIAAPGDVVGTLAQIQRIAGNTSTNSIYFCTSLVQDMVIGAPGNTLTLSFKALCGANFSPTSNQITVTVFTGTGNTYKSGLLGAYTGSTAVINTIFSISTTLTQYTVTTASPIGTNVSQLAVQFGWAPTGTAGTNDFVSFTDVQLEVSPQASSYDRLNFPQTVSQCQRFYYKTFPYTVAPVTNYSTTYIASPSTATAGATCFLNNFTYPVPMLANPTVTFYNPAIASPTTGFNQLQDASIGLPCTSTGAAGASMSGLVPFGVLPAGGAVGHLIIYHLTADIDVI